MKVKVTMEFEFDDLELDQGETLEQWAKRKWHEESWYITDCADRSALVKVEEVVIDREALDRDTDRMMDKGQ